MESEQLNQSGAVMGEEESKKNKISYGKAKMIFKLKGKRVLEQIRALKLKR